MAKEFNTHIIPAPIRTEKKEGGCMLPYTGVICLDESCAKDAYIAADQIKKAIKETLGFNYEIRRGTAGKSFDITFKIKEGIEAEHYLLEIFKGRIRITAGEKKGLLYGAASLIQLLTRYAAVLPCLIIEDGPAMKNRGYMMDCTRGRIPTLDFMKKVADTMCSFKMNQLQLYIEHTFAYTNLSEVKRGQMPLTAEEIMEFDDYCYERGIELIPAIGSFGHMYRMLSSKSFRHLSELRDDTKTDFSFDDRMHHHTIDVTNEDSIPFVENIIMELMPLFRTDKFNLGADETFDLGKGKSKEAAEEHGVNTLYVDFVKKLCEIVTKHGHIPMIWGDILLSEPERIKELPRETICLNWDYSPNVKETGTKAYAEVTKNQYVCPGVGGWNMMVTLIGQAFTNITKMCTYGKKFHAAGMLNTSWGDFGHINHPPFSIVGLIYGAAASWSVENPEFEKINKDISALIFGDREKNIVDVIDRLSLLNTFNWKSIVLFKEYHENNMIEPNLTKEEKAEKAKTKVIAKKPVIEKAAETNAEIIAVKKTLQRKLKNIERDRRQLVYPYLLAADGLMIMNRIGAQLLRCLEWKKDKKLMDIKCKRLATDIERFFEKYQLLWRSVSKESELYRVGEVFFYYADYFRTYAEL